MYTFSFHNAGAGISGIFVVGMVYASTVTSAIVIFTMATMLANINAVGPSASIIELAPKYSGILMGIINFICGIAGFISPQVVGTLTVHGVNSCLFDYDLTVLSYSI